MSDINEIVFDNTFNFNNYLEIVGFIFKSLETYLYKYMCTVYI